MPPLTLTHLWTYRWISLRHGLVLILLLGAATRGVDAAAPVVPPECEGVDGNAMYADTAPPAAGGRCQELYEASYFAGVQAGVVVRMACRPDYLVRARRTVQLRNYQLRLSTTSRGPGQLSSRFDDNLGPDVTLVFAGDVTWTTDGDGPAMGPRGFDYVVVFQRPFWYDPGQGNLLVEWRVADSPQGLPAFDAQLHRDGRSRLLWGNAATATTANFSNAGQAVRQFTIEPLGLAIRRQTDAVWLVLTGPPGWIGLVQRSSDLLTWEEWYDLTFTAIPDQISDPSVSGEPRYFYRLVLP